MRALFLTAGFLILIVTFIPVHGADVPALPDGTGIPQPLIPHSFYGSVTAAGSPVPEGVPVMVEAVGIRKGIAGNPVYSREGEYGSADPFKPRLEAQGVMDPGTELVFFVGGVRAEVRPSGTDGEWQSSFSYSPGAVTSLDLQVSIPVTPDPDYRRAPGESGVSPSTTSPPGQQTDPSRNVMIGLIAVLVVLGLAAVFLGRRAEQKKKDKQEGKHSREECRESPPEE